ncbi:MAG: polysaccharide biosynthesis C-terminal domain-containing protein [Candidatus Krumholzibacteriota bacterium]|nr:polysaccharide biosynthesis C-terminal domain-containing protein [Candidatus Krumholzibacteriota bacterium]
MSVERVGRAMTWSVLARVARFAAGPIAYVVIVRSLGETDWGILSILRTISSLALIVVTAGGGNALLRFLPQLRVTGGAGRFMARFRFVLLAQAVVWGALLGVSRLVGDRVGRLVGAPGEGFTGLLLVAIGVVIFEVMLRLVTSALQSWYETRRLAIVTVAGNIAYVILLVLFLKSGTGIVGVLFAGAIVNLAMSVLLARQVFSLVCSAPEAGGEAPRVGRIFAFSLPFVATGLLNEIVWRHSEVLFLGHFAGVEAAGYFGLAYRTTQQFLEFVPLSIWPIVMAGVTEAYAKDRNRLAGSIDLYYRLLYILVMPVAALGFALSRPLVPFLFGEAMAPAAQVTQLFFVVFSYSFLYTPLSMALYVMEKSWLNMLTFAMLAAVNIGLDLVFIPRIGIDGALLSVALVLALSVAVFGVVVKRVRPDIRIPFGFVLRCYAACLPTALIALTSSRWHSVPALAIQALAGIVLLYAGFRAMRVIGAREKEMIARLPIPFKGRLIALF